MTQQISPWLEGKWGWNLGEDGWNTGADENWLKFSFMFDRNVDSIVASLPTAVNGQAHYLTTDNRLYFVVGTTYYSTPVPKWFTVVVKSTGATHQFNGTTLVQIDNPAELDARLDAVEPTVSSFGTAALKDVEFFASQANLDVAEATAAAYTDTLRLDLLSDTGSLNVGYKNSGTGAVATTAEGKLESVAVDAVVDFGADNTGLTNTTTTIKAFFDHCILTGDRGHIPSGSYLITAGELVFDTPFTDVLWPEITTDGHDTVTFLRADATDAPMIALTNGTADSLVGKYWRGGSLGGITFDQNGQTVGTNQHGLSLRGVWATKFGWMRAEDLGGSCIAIPEALYTVTNPDPYAVTFCEFDGIEANRCGGFGLDNRNYLGFNSCSINGLRVIQCLSGGWYGLGTGNYLRIASMGSIKGWAFDDGTNVAATGGAPFRNIIKMAELDDCQYGIRLNRSRMTEFKFIRFVHRYNFSVLNTDNKYWPLKAVEFAAGASAGISDVSITAQHRIEAGGAKPDIGVFVDLSSNANIVTTAIDQQIFDNAALGFVDSDLFANVSTSSRVLLRNTGVVIFDSQIKAAALVRSSTSNTVPNTGFGGSGGKITFATELYDRTGAYDTSNSWFTIPFTGVWRVTGKICLTMAVGSRVRFGFGTDVGGVVTTQLAKQEYQVNAGAQHYSIDGVLSLTAGQRLFFMADQNTAGAVNLSAPFSTTADLTWSVEAL